MPAIRIHKPNYAEVDKFRKSTTPEADAWIFDPPLARWILEHAGDHNRSLSRSNITQLRKAIAEGRYQFTGETIIFCSDGTLGNGFHTMTAVAESDNGEITRAVWAGTNPDAFKVIDTGKKRSIANIFEIAKIPNARSIAAASTWLSFLTGNNPLGDRDSREPEEVLAAYQGQWPDLGASLDDTVREIAKRKHPVGVLLACKYLSEKVDSKKAERFWKGWATGIGTSTRKRDAVIMLNNELNRRVNSGEGRVHDRDRPLLIATCWQAFRSGRTISDAKLKKLYAKEGPDWPGFA